MFSDDDPNDEFASDLETGKSKKYTCGQSYKGSMIVNYNSRVVIWGIFKSGTTLES